MSKSSKLRKLQKKYTPERCQNIQGKAILSDRFYVPNEYVTSRMLDKYTDTVASADVELDEFGEPIDVDEYLLGYKEYTKATAFHRGDMLKHDVTFSKVYRELKVLDLRSQVRMKNKIKFTGKLRPHQKKPADEYLDYGYGTFKAQPRFGKCVLGDTLIPSSDGLLYIEEMCSSLKLEDSFEKKVFTVQNRYGDREDTSHIYRGLTSKAYKIISSLGYELGGTKEHPILVLTDKLELVWKDLSSIKIGDIICINKKSFISKKSLVSFNNFKSPKLRTYAKDFLLPKYCTKSVARFLGYMVSEGTLNYYTHWKFTNADKEINKDFKEIFSKIFLGYCKLGRYYQNRNKKVIETQGSSKKLTAFLEYLGVNKGLSKDRKIPWCIRKSPKNIIAAFLKAYFEGDGWVEQASVNCCSTSENLIREIQVILLYSFGILSKRWSKEVETDKGIKPYYMLRIGGKYATKYMKNIGFVSYRKNSFAHTLIRKKSCIDYYGFVPDSETFISENVISKSFGSGVYSIKGKIKDLNVATHTRDKRFRHHDLSSDLLDNIKLIDKKTYSVLKELKTHLNVEFDCVVKKKVSKTPKKVYDLVVPGTHSFIANGVVSHNTVTFIYMMCKLRYKTLFLVHQVELARQFIKELKEFTNVNSFDEPPYCILSSKNWNAIKKHDICVSTWQLFHASGKSALRKYRNEFGLVWVDESHKASADCFSGVAQKFNSTVRGGCTATEDRKDGMHPIAFNVIGPVTVEGITDKVPIEAYIHKTGFKPDLGKNFMWSTLEKTLAFYRPRNDMIIKQILQDLKEDKQAYILVATRPVKHILLLVRRLTDEGISAVAFYGGSKNREQLLIDMKRGRYRVVVANRSMLTGINVPRWSFFYNCMPTSNKPQYKQEFWRIRTPYTYKIRKRKNGKVVKRLLIPKKRGIVRDYVDDFGACWGCLKKRREVYDLDDAVKVRYAGTDTPGAKCGKCDKFTFCNSKKDITINTSACEKFVKKKKRGMRRLV